MNKLEGIEVTWTNQNLQEKMFDPKYQAKQDFKNFILQFHIRNQRIYHDQLISNINNTTPTVATNVGDLKAWNQDLVKRLRESPIDTIEQFHRGLKQIAESYKPVGQCQVQIWSDQNPITIRELLAQKVNRLVTINGIIISASKPFQRGSKLILACSNCNQKVELNTPIGQQVTIPRKCTAPRRNAQSRAMMQCPLDSYKVCPGRQYVEDYQYLKIEQNPWQIKVGETPKTFNLLMGRSLVDSLCPGQKVTISGTLMVINKKSKGSNFPNYLWVLGYNKHSQKQEINFSLKDQEEFKQFSKDPDLYKKIGNSIAPKIHGHPDIKKAIACQLFSGSRKVLPDNTILRGDINILLVGDPSTAKSQFLLFAQKLSYISVYTAGKSSSAAGLTASINKDIGTGEFEIEAGALVRADGGLVCIDEFDKMKPGDRVAIHQAMEQQTISISKAGLNLRLNSRTSVLAAANPMFGKYDDSKKISDQIELQSTIMSRFDCIFIIKDVRNEAIDRQISEHVYNLHQKKHLIQLEPEVNMQFLKKYICYSRNKISPRLTVEATQKLKQLYVEDRKLSKIDRQTTKHAIPITVRQLEAIIRLSQVKYSKQSLAKMELKPEVRQEHVNEAHRLFKSSTMNSIKNRREMGIIPGMSDQIKKIEEVIRKRIYVGLKISVKNLTSDIGERFEPVMINYAINNMIHNGEFKETNKGLYLIRQR